jgi:hypothetical protein
MKEIDFIPQWYKAGRERKRRCIRQYTLMAAVFTVMVGWGFIVDSHISRVSAEERKPNCWIRSQLGQTLRQFLVNYHI